MTTSKFFVPALLAVTLVGGATFATTAFSAPHGGGHGNYRMADDNTSGGMGGCPGMQDDGRGYHQGGRGYHQGGMGYHMGQAYNSLTPEKRVKFDAMLDELQGKMRPLRDAIYVKKQELHALQNSANPDVNAVSKTATEITQLREKMRTEHDNFVTKLEKDLGIKDYYGSDAAQSGQKPAPKK